MNGQTSIVMGIGVVTICSIVFVLTLPTLAGMVVRGNPSGALRLAIPLAALAIVVLAVAAALGASLDIYSILI